MGRRGNQTFLKNQKAQKRVARANAKRVDKQAKRDDKVARAASGDLPYGSPIEGLEPDDLPGNGAATLDGEEGDDELEPENRSADLPLSTTEH